MASSAGRGRTSEERRRGRAGRAASSSAGSGAAAGDFGRVGGSAGGAPKRSSCICVVVSLSSLCVDRTAVSSLEVCDKALQNGRLNGLPPTTFQTKRDAMNHHHPTQF